MTPERWEQIEPIYHAALEKAPAERSGFLTEACAGDAELCDEIAGLLSCDRRAEHFIEKPALEVAARALAASPPQLPHPAIPTQISSYRILAPLGRGGMGEVYLALDSRLGRKVAIKLLPARFTTNPDRVRRFEQEAHAVSALNHPNIITIHEIGETAEEAGGTHYIVTEYIEGETLRQHLKNTPQQRLRPDAALDIAVQITAALAIAHENGIIHRDIKPENVMLRKDGIVKVLDFGLAKLSEQQSDGATEEQSDGTTERPGEDDPTLPFSLHPSAPPSQTGSGAMLGTPRYMSPEQAGGKKVDARTDIFSLGIMLYEMIAGYAPFACASPEETMAAILHDEPSPLVEYAPEMPGALERIVRQALSKERTDRYQTARTLLSDLKELKQRLEIQSKLGEGDWASSSRLPALTEKDLILLADFENKTTDEIFDSTLKQGLAIQLRQSPFLGLFPEERVRQTLRLMKRSPDERVTTRIAREICVRNNLKALIAGSIAPLGSHYVITLEAIYGQTGETIETDQVEADNKEQVLRALSQAAARLRAKLGESLSSIQQFNTELEEITTPKLEAFQAYSLGYEQTLNGRLLDAIQLYRRAVELDPDLAYAWSMLNIHHNVIGQPGLAAEYAEKAYALKDRVSDYEQLQITFRYHFMGTGDMHKALEAANLFKRIYPRTSTAPIDVLVSHDLLGQHDLAVAEGYDAIRLNPNYAPAYWYLGRSLLRVSQFAEAKEIFQQALEKKFDLTNIHTALYQIAFAEGNADGMQEQLNWAKGRPDEYVTFDWQAGATAFAGQWRKAQEFARRAIDLTAHGITKELAARYATEQALRGAILGDYQQAATDAEQGLKIERGRASLPRAALALALGGAAEQAKPLIDELHKRYPEDTVINFIWLPVIRAALLLAENNFGKQAEQALEQLQVTASYEAAAEFWPQTLRGQAYLQLRRGEDAAQEFQKILAYRGQSPLSPLFPLAHLGLARAAALGGDTTRSRKSWEDFSAAWREADADQPILLAAQREFEPLPVHLR